MLVMQASDKPTSIRPLGFLLPCAWVAPFSPSITLPATVKVQCDDAELASRERQLGTS